MHKYHWGYLGRDIYATYCECGWHDRAKSRDETFVLFMEHLERLGLGRSK